jgi:hypothetical protein
MQSEAARAIGRQIDPEGELGRLMPLWGGNISEIQYAQGDPNDS